jgi:hypothetical protein
VVEDVVELVFDNFEGERKADTGVSAFEFLDGIEDTGVKYLVLRI